MGVPEMRRRRLGALSFSFGHASRGLVRLLLAQIFDGLLGAPFACFRGLIVRALAAVGGRAAVGCDSTVTGGLRFHRGSRLPDHTLTIGPLADMKAEISAKVVVIMGRGHRRCDGCEKVEIRAIGSATGDI